MTTAGSKARRYRLAPYWSFIAALLLLTAVLYIYHLVTGVTPDRVALRIEALGFDVFWYGIWIVGGIALGSWVVASLAEGRAEELFTATVPDRIRRIPLASLSPPAALVPQLEKSRVSTLGKLLFLWGLNPQNLNLKKAEREELGAWLARQPPVKAQWVHDAPWRIWSPDHVWNGIIWCLIFAIIGARLYHVLTPSPSMAAVGIESPLDYFRNPFELVNIRSGGLGIYGGIAGGAVGLWIYARRQRIPVLSWADLAVVGLALGQVFGRWGNFFNQELYGRPTTLPWAVYIDPAHRLPQYADVGFFHPAFLYESLWSLMTFFVLYALVTRYRRQMLTGEVMALYLIFYAIGRTLLELVRLDSRTLTIAGVDTNLAIATAVSLLVALVMAGWILYRRWRRGGGIPRTV